MRLYLIRHGQSANNAARDVVTRGTRRGYPGRIPDPELTALGCRQADALAEAVRTGRTPLPLTHLYSSLQLRAVQTAARLADVLDLPVVLRDDAHEVGGVHRVDPHTGERHPVNGHSIRELRAIQPRVVPDGDGDHDLAWHGGFETEDDAFPRAQRLLAELRARHDSADEVAVVSHQHFGQFVLAAVLGVTTLPRCRFRIDNTGHVAIDFAGAHPRVQWVNRCEHLQPGEITN